MSLPGGQQRILEDIEGGLADSDPALASLFVIFGRLVEGEAMPWLESIRARPVVDRLVAAIVAVGRLLGRMRRAATRPAAGVRALLLVPAALIAMACAVTIAAVSPGGQRSTHARQPAGRELVVKGRPCRPGVLRIPAFTC